MGLFAKRTYVSPSLCQSGLSKRSEGGRVAARRAFSGPRVTRAMFARVRSRCCCEPPHGLFIGRAHSDCCGRRRARKKERADLSCAARDRWELDARVYICGGRRCASCCTRWNAAAHKNRSLLSSVRADKLRFSERRSVFRLRLYLAAGDDFSNCNARCIHGNEIAIWPEKARHTHFETFTCAGLAKSGKLKTEHCPTSPAERFTWDV